MEYTDTTIMQFGKYILEFQNFQKPQKLRNQLNEKRTC